MFKDRQAEEKWREIWEIKIQNILRKRNMSFPR